MSDNERQAKLWGLFNHLQQTIDDINRIRSAIVNDERNASDYTPNDLDYLETLAVRVDNSVEILADTFFDPTVQGR